MFPTRTILIAGILIACVLVAGESAIVPASAEELAPVALNSLSSPPPGLATAQVFDEQGHLVGTVGKIQIDPAGKPAALSVIAAGGKSIFVVAAPAASYDASKNIVVASLPAAAPATR